MDINATAHEQVASMIDGAMASLDNLPKKDMTEPSSESDGLKKNMTVDQLEFEEDVEYVEPMQDPYNRSIKYLEQHNVMQLFQQLTASIVYNKPEHPLEFMMLEVEKMKRLKEAEMNQKN